MAKSLKEKILELRLNNKSYDEIKLILGCAKSTISYHCKNNGLEKYSKIEDDIKVELNQYYLTHTIEETADKFNISKSSVIRYVENKHIKLSIDALKAKNYQRVKNSRQKIKEKAVEYKGGCCEKCGYNKCLRALEFHHLDPNKKDFGIGSYASFSWDKIKKELNKCILVCANCHREIHDKIVKRDVSPRTDTALKG